MRFNIAFALAAGFTSSLFGQLTTDQKTADFMQLAGLYAKNYAPYEWKRDVIGFDALQVGPWLDQVKKSKDDLEFYDICVRYVASLQDSYDEFVLPSDFVADLHVYADIYDGKVLIDTIDRRALPAKDYPFQIGDELVSVDGIPVEQWITDHVPYAANGSANASTRRRLAADTLTFRYQGFFPRAHEIGDSAVLVVRDDSGNTASYTLPWDKTGTPLTTAGPVPSPAIRAARTPLAMRKDVQARRAAARRKMEGLAAVEDNAWGAWTDRLPPAEPEDVPAYLAPLRELQTMEFADTPLGAAGFGSLFPPYNPPAGFRLRLGGRTSDQFLSGTFPAGNKTVGFIRIPTMSPTSTTTAVSQFAGEIAYFKANTDGLVVDVMRNGGGSLCYTETLLSYLIPYPFRSTAYEIRATQYWVEAFSSLYYTAKDTGAEGWVTDLYAAYLAEVRQAMREYRGRTGNLPICGPTFENIPPATDKNGAVLAYTKPILLLMDEYTLSASEAFSAFLQDANRATFFGVRTDGGGGNPGSYMATTYSEATTRVTRTLVTRAAARVSPGFPATTYIENVGVYPDIWNDFMTRDNLMQGGQPFVDAFSAAIVGLIAGQ